MFTIIDDCNREEIENRYIQHLIAHMDFMQVRDVLRTYLKNEKNSYSHLDLEIEILRQAPEVISESNIDPLLIGGGYQNA